MLEQHLQPIESLTSEVEPIQVKRTINLQKPTYKLRLYQDFLCHNIRNDKQTQNEGKRNKRTIFVTV